jgi:hypothetical protein
MLLYRWPLTIYDTIVESPHRTKRDDSWAREEGDDVSVFAARIWGLSDAAERTKGRRGFVRWMGAQFVLGDRRGRGGGRAAE